MRKSKCECECTTFVMLNLNVKPFLLSANGNATFFFFKANFSLLELRNMTKSIASSTLSYTGHLTKAFYTRGEGQNLQNI